ncbi:MAG TPA: methyl-accepting chemotaxis protein [Pseudobacteroides sp.]|uniref:methyl-accepting chemotaxis protein n=1 Tax=Pseudobacteroides sp. TaxID=1968840 RepID=UPI002F93B6B9
MKWFHDLKIKVKLILCFIVLAVFTGIVGFIGITNMGAINKRGDEIYTNNFISAQNLSNIHKSLLNIRSNYFLMIYERDVSKLQSRLDEMNKLTEQNNKYISDYENSMAEEEKDLFNKFKLSLDEYRKIRGEHITYIQAGKYDEAISRIQEFAKAREDVESNIQSLVDYNIKSAEEKSIQNTESYQQQSVIMIIIIIIGILLAIGIGFYIANLISKPVNQIVSGASKIADGNLNVTIDIDTKDEIGVLANVFSKMVENLNEVMVNINSAAEQVASGSKQISDSSTALSQGATEQASSIEELTASIEEISSQTRQNADYASQANTIAETAKLTAVKGNEQMSMMLRAMDDINESSSKISRIIKVIDEIAFQTNILALNAAVEAARAGQHGKGFAVVAEEVRNLAARSANAAKETTDMIEGSIKKVEDGTNIASETANALNSMIDSVTKVANLVNDIAIASNEQATGIAQVNQGIMQVSQVVQTNSATSEECAASSEELASQAELLKEQVGRFKLKKNSVLYKDMNDLNPNVLRMLEGVAKKKSINRIKLNEIDTNDKEFGKY